MVAYEKYDTAIEKLCNKLIDAFGSTDTWNAIIHTDAPVRTTDSIIGDLTQITGTNGYTTNGLSIGFGSTRLGTNPSRVEATAADQTWNASGTWPAAQYVTIVDFTATAKDVWCWFDYGSTFTVASGETFTLDFGTVFFTIT